MLDNRWSQIFTPKSEFIATGARALLRMLTGIIVILVLAGCGAGPADLPCERDPRCLRYGLTADIPILDPHYAEAAEAGMIFRQIYDTLVYRDADTHEFVPGLAADWDVSSDGLTYTFQLRSEVEFHDGSRFDAAAVGRNIERIFAPDIPQSTARDLLGPLAQYEVTDDYTIRLILASPFPGLLEGLSHPYLGIASPAALETYDNLRYQFHQAGTGPFSLEKYLPGERIVLRRFSEYRVAPAIYAPLSGDEITRVEFVLDRAGEVDALSALGESLDILDDLSPADAQTLAGNSRIQIFPVDIPGLSVSFIFNTARQPVSIKAVRLALLLATNRVAISDRVYFNFSAVAWAPLSASTGYSHTGYIDQYAYDLGVAQALLAEEGFDDSDGDGVLDRGGAPLTLSIVVPPWGRLPAVAATLQQQWRALGVDLQIEPIPGRSRLLNLMQSGQYDLIPVDEYGIDPNVLSRVFLGGPVNAPYEQLQNLLRQSRHTIDDQLRRKQVYDIQAQIMEEVLILPIREAVRLTAARADLRDLGFDVYGFYPLLFNTSVAGA